VRVSLRLKDVSPSIGIRNASLTRQPKRIPPFPSPLLHDNTTMPIPSRFLPWLKPIDVLPLPLLVLLGLFLVVPLPLTGRRQQGEGHARLSEGLLGGFKLREELLFRFKRDRRLFVLAPWCETRSRG